MSCLWIVNEDDWLDVEKAVICLLRSERWNCSLFSSFHYMEFRLNAMKFVQDPTTNNISSNKLVFADSDICIEISAIHPEGILEVVVFREYIV